MDTLDHLTPIKLQKAANRLSTIRGSLNGLGALFLFQARESCIDQDEMAGIGYLIQEFSKETSRIEDILRCGHDSVTKAETERDYEDEPWEEDDDESPGIQKSTPFAEILEKLVPSLEKLSAAIVESKASGGGTK